MAFEHYDKCSLLLPMDGANNGTVFNDWSPSPKTIARFGNTETVTAQAKYYGSSAFFDGSADYLSGEAIDLIGSNWTVAAWIRPNSKPAARIFATGGGTVAWNGTTGIHLLFGLSNTTPQKLSVQHYNGSGATSISGATDINTSGVWSHVAATFDGTTVRGFLNGVLEFSSTVIIVKPTGTPTWAVATIPGEAGGSATAFNGHINDIIVINGAALWTDNFTPPARLIGELSNTNAPNPIQDENGDPAQRKIIAVPRGVPSRAFGTVSDTDGEFTLRAPATECSLIALHDGDPIKNDLIARVIPA
jgi:hypothetical protein